MVLITSSNKSFIIFMFQSVGDSDHDSIVRDVRMPFLSAQALLFCIKILGV